MTNGTTTNRIQINRFSGGASASLGSVTAFGTNEREAREMLREKRAALLIMANIPPVFVADPTGASLGWMIWHENLTFRTARIYSGGIRGCTSSYALTSCEDIKREWADFVATWQEHAQSLA